MCGFADHRDEHYRNGAFDANYRIENGHVTWDKISKGSSKSGGPKAGPKGGSPKGADRKSGWKLKYPHGTSCNKLGTKQGYTDYWHPDWHYNPNPPAAGDGKAPAASSRPNSKGKVKGKKGKHLGTRTLAWRHAEAGFSLRPI